jgi:ubiquinone/menaquinone biosynthesis C-methylase UbiE
VSGALQFTGERFVPGAPGEIWYEHWHRYHFAAPLAKDRDVLDVACGEGYGSALLARNAHKVTGVDLATAAIEHARARYADRRNLDFRAADCSALPFPDASFDAVVSFETIEHIAAQEAFLDEVRRVLRPEGLFILSCPNKAEYTDKRSTVNEFHVRELYRDELEGLLAPRFAHVAWYGQRPGFFSVVWPEQGAARGEIFELSEGAADAPTQGHARPLYFIAVASGAAAALAAVVPRVSVLADRDEWVYRNYEEVTRGYLALERERAARQAPAPVAGDAEATALRDALRAAVAAAASSDAERSRLAQELSTRQAEVMRRASLRWWLALPFRRLRNVLRGEPPWT